MAQGASGGLEHLDRRILDAIAADGRSTPERIAADLALEPADVRERLSRLVADGVLRATLDGYVPRSAVEAFVELYCVAGTTRADLEVVIGDFPEFAGAWAVTGEADVIALVRVRDMGHLDEVVLRLQATGCVRRTRSQIATATLAGAHPR